MGFENPGRPWLFVISFALLKRLRRLRPNVVSGEIRHMDVSTMLDMTVSGLW